MPRSGVLTQPPDPPCRVLKTGQTTQYSSELDDGFYQKGVAKSYTVLTTGQYSGTSNVDLIHYTAATISFDAGTKEIRDSANGMALFKTDDIIVVTNSASNNGVFTVATGNVAAKAVVTEALVDEAAAATISIAKRESKSNNCVMDNNTGLMWMRDPSNYPAKMGLTSTGKMPWTTALYDVFQYCAACNVALVGGYGDWRVPNKNEYNTLLDSEAPTGLPDATAFPNAPSDNLHTSTTKSDGATSSIIARFTAGTIYYSGIAKATDAQYVALVRGGR